MIFGAFLVIKFITAVLFIQFSNLKELHGKKELYRKMMKVIERRKQRGEWSHFGNAAYVAPDSRSMSSSNALVVDARVSHSLIALLNLLTDLDWHVPGNNIDWFRIRVNSIIKIIA
jgi:hypothetical protein